jgi:hypothetical protein
MRHPSLVDVWCAAGWLGVTCSCQQLALEGAYTVAVSSHELAIAQLIRFLRPLHFWRVHNKIWARVRNLHSQGIYLHRAPICICIRKRLAAPARWPWEAGQQASGCLRKRWWWIAAALRLMRISLGAESVLILSPPHATLYDLRTWAVTDGWNSAPWNRDFGFKKHAIPSLLKYVL